MNSSKKFISQIFLVVFFYLFFDVPNSALGLVFDRVVAKINSEIITLSSVQEKVEILKQKYNNNKASIDEKKLLKEAVEMMVAEKLQLQEGKKMGLLVEDSAVEAALKNIEKNNGLEEGQLKVMLESEGRSLESYKEHIRDQIGISKITRLELGRRIIVSD
ncbi:MAG: SurA N-terminal domain-containing protein, partial [Nitrospinota bacterium]|nr:SurA N-terminal domain-containing protein [Nitrospinota bacterium]